MSTPPPRLYKYRKLDEHTIPLIINGVIYFAEPSQFNDPFDCRFRYDLTGTESEWREFFMRHLTQLRLELSPREVHNMVEAKAREGAFKDTRLLGSLSDDCSRHRNQRLGILCLTASPTNILMWSHYADAHKGYCLEFSTDAPPFKRASQVRYPPKYPNVRYLDCIEKPDTHVELTTLTKAGLWKYEEEWRVIHIKGPGLIKFDERSLTAIICGHWMTEENVDLLKGLVKRLKHKVQLYRAAPNDKEFEMKLMPLEEDQAIDDRPGLSGPCAP